MCLIDGCLWKPPDFANGLCDAVCRKEFNSDSGLVRPHALGFVSAVVKKAPVLLEASRLIPGRAKYFKNTSVQLLWTSESRPVTDV